jgi:hypothetical protein
MHESADYLAEYVVLKGQGLPEEASSPSTEAQTSKEGPKTTQQKETPLFRWHTLTFIQVLQKCLAGLKSSHTTMQRHRQEACFYLILKRRDVVPLIFCRTVVGVSNLYSPCLAVKWQGAFHPVQSCYCQPSLS